MRKNTILCLFIAVFISACGNNNSTKPNTGFDKEVSLSSKVVISDLFVDQYPESMFFVDSLLGILSSEMGEGILSLYSLQTGQEKGRYGNRGRGPGEFIYAKYVATNPNGALYLADMDNSITKISTKDQDGKVVFDTEFKTPVGNNSKVALRHTCQLDNGFFVTTCELGIDKNFALYDKDLNFIECFGNGQFKADFSINNTPQGIIQSKGNGFVYSYLGLPYISFFAMEGDSLVCQWEDDSFYESYYKVSNGQITYSREQTKGFTRSISLTDNYIYVLFLDKKKYNLDFTNPEDVDSNLVFVYNYSGERVAKYRLDKKIKCIVVNEDDTKMYGFYRIDEFAVLEFDI